MRLNYNNGHIFTYQAPATLNQAAPVQNTWYTILNDVNVRIYDICLNVEDADETIECQITIDGETIAANDQALTHSTNYYCYMENSAVSQIDTVRIGASDYPSRAFLVEGKSVKVEVRKTTAAGAGNLMAIITWGKLEAI